MACDVRPVHLAARGVERDSERLFQPGDEDFNAAAVQIGLLDLAEDVARGIGSARSGKGFPVFFEPELVGPSGSLE